MRTMTTAQMMEANGGRYRWKCSYCGRKFMTKLATRIHCIFHHEVSSWPVRV